VNQVDSPNAAAFFLMRLTELGLEGLERFESKTVHFESETVHFGSSAALVTSLDLELLSVAQLYRDRGDSENSFDELKNQWGWAGFTTVDINRCQIMARLIALVYNWWTLYVRLADPEHHHEALTTRSLLLNAVGRQTQHAGQTRLTITSSHSRRAQVESALTGIARFFAWLKKTAEQLTAIERWTLILSHALRKFLRGRKLQPPPNLLPA